MNSIYSMDRGYRGYSSIVASSYSVYNVYSLYIVYSVYSPYPLQRYDTARKKASRKRKTDDTDAYSSHRYP